MSAVPFTSPTIYWLCDLGQVSLLLSALVSSSVATACDCYENEIKQVSIYKGLRTVPGTE